ncbi:MAG: AMP-binding protein [Gammaproteobacteria bacterium]|nr:AMP-binding protein [Gammaproteobacteria bacterium]
MHSVVIRRFITSAAANGDRIAIVDAAGNTTSRQLMERAQTFANRLTSQKLRRVGLLADNSSHWIAFDLGARMAGATLVPLPPFFTSQQLQHVIDAAALQAVATDARGALAALGDKVLDTTGYGPLTLARLRHEENALNGSRLGDYSKITFTSGTTGTPKGVCLTDAAIDKVAIALAQAVESLDLQRHLNLLPLSTLLENIAGVYVPLMLGRTINALPLAALGFSASGVDPQRLATLLSAVDPDSMILVPELLQMLVNLPVSLHARTKPKFLPLGGGKTAPSLIQDAVDQGWPVFEGYGLSEAASVVTLNLPDANRIGSVGKPLSGRSVRIVDGEIEVAGHEFAGYLGELDAQPAWLKTGDLGELDDDGYLYITGRRRDVIVTSYGRNVSPEWVEAELRRDGSIAQCLVFGEARPCCGALIVPATGTDVLRIAHSITRANERLPGYAQIKLWVAADGPFDAERGFRTANGRLRRDRILAAYHEKIAHAYQSNSRSSER